MPFENVGVRQNQCDSGRKIKRILLIWFFVITLWETRAERLPALFISLTYLHDEGRPHNVIAFGGSGINIYWVKSHQQVASGMLFLRASTPQVLE